MRRAVLLFLLLFTVPAISASAAISGSVWSRSGPVSGARVTVRRPVAPFDLRLALLAGKPPALLDSTTTNDKGEFALSQKIDGVVFVVVEADGFAPETIVTTGDDADVIATLTPAARRTGRVTANGKGVAGAVVVALQDETPWWWTRTGDDGSFTIADPAPWTKQIAIVHPDYAPKEIKPQASLDVALTKGSAITGNVVNASGRPVAKAHVSAGLWNTAISADDGAFTIANVPAGVKKVEAFLDSASGGATLDAKSTTIAITERSSISGMIRDANKRPLAYGVVVGYLFRKDEREMSIAIADDRGRFRLERSENGTYTLMAFPVADLRFESVSAKSGANDVNLVATAATYIRGVVVDEQKRPVAGATVQYASMQLGLMYAHTSQGAARTGADGRFKLQTAEEIRAHAASLALRLNALHPHHALGLTEPLDFKSSVTITLPAGIEVRGTVVDAKGNAVAGAGIVAIQDPKGAVPMPLDVAMQSKAILPFVETDAEGKFTMRLNRAPHDFAAWKSETGSARVGSVEIVPGADPLQLVLESGVAIRGRIKSGEKVIAGGMVIASSDRLMAGTTEVGTDGTFVLEGLREGTYELSYRNEDGRNASTHAAAPSDDVLIEVPEMGTVRGKVIDSVTKTALRSYSVTAPTAMESEDVEDADTFTLELPAGETTLSVTAESYAVEDQHVNVVAGKTTEVTIVATKGRVASGSVTNERGEPIEDAYISASDGDAFESTDADGTYSITLPKQPLTMSVRAMGYAEKDVAVEGDGDVRVDIVLSRGRVARGRVVTNDGAPIAGAEVSAMGSAYQRATSDEDGAFLVQGLGEGLYSFSAKFQELSSEDMDPVDPASGEIVLRMKPSTGAGVVHGRVKGFIEGRWAFGFVQSEGEHAAINRDGTYRFERLPAGEIELRAIASDGNDGMSSSPAVKVTVVAGDDVEADLEFVTGTTIRGTVYRDGTPAPYQRMVFANNDQQWSTRSNQKGEYSITGIPAGTVCNVAVMSQPTYQTKYTVTGAAVFDIHMAWSRIEGRVIDDTAAPVAGAAVSIKAGEAEESTKTDPSGAFTVSAQKGSAPVVVTVEKDGFATVTRNTTADGAPLLIAMTRTEGLRVRLVDARSGNTLDGYAIAVDEAGNLLARANDQQPDGTLRIPLTTGEYRIAVSANGYASLSTRSAMPRKDELRIALTPGGKLVLNTDRASNDVIKLVLPNGEEYVQCQCNGIAEIRLTGTKTTVEHVAPGRYTMHLYDERGLIKASHPVAIAEGQTTVLDLNVPE